MKMDGIKALQVVACDVNGIARGKRYPAHGLDKILDGSMRFPLSVMNLDLWGDDIEDSPLVLESGDRDGALRPTGRGPLPVPWLTTPTAMVPVWMYAEDGAPFAGDPRHALARVLDRYNARGWRPVVALELEFILYELGADKADAPSCPVTGRPQEGGEILSLAALERFDPFLTALYDACAAMEIPADSLISESGLGQFEVNLLHTDDALRAADDAWLFKLMVKGVARQHGLGASFAAKPYQDWSGSGLHMHVSILDGANRNVFDNGDTTGAEVLHHAIAGSLDAMAASTLIFAPFPGSYDRFVPGAHAPTSVCWGYENRTAAIRVPGGNPAARRMEHRLAGGDANPYLLIAAILGGMMNGIDDRVDPPTPITGNAYEQSFPQVPITMEDALTSFEQSPLVARIFDPLMIDNILRTKRQEVREFAEMDPEATRGFLLDRV